MLSDMTIRVEAGENVAVVFLAGDLDWDGAQTLKRCVLHLSAGHRTPGVIIDLSEVLFTDSSGLDALADCQKVCEASGIAFGIRNPSPLMGRMLVATGDADRLPIVGTAHGLGALARSGHGWAAPDGAEGRDSIADRRDLRADERDRRADLRDADFGAHALEVEVIMLAAAQRDSAAEGRDRLAEERDAAAIHRPGRQDADKRDAGIAAIDRWHAGADRDVSADDRHDLAKIFRADSARGNLRSAAALERAVDGDARDKAVLERTRVAMKDEQVTGTGPQRSERGRDDGAG